MVNIIQQQTFSMGGLETSIFLLEIDAITRRIARIKSRSWARAEFPFTGPNDITILGARSVRDTPRRNIRLRSLRTDYRVQVSVRN